ncbi:dienelactone hydrolase family protein [Stackebrandtia nassauensis]|uniref:Dienelactone hydrolase n=1 Tax=Stackebrandtia nassauensis (strain DSM 44728 / CIP 108903 / NRRL B-16338 / NBRC 102104 / LLR-40K-21) TaxID=446470 RepID=D3PWC2_STANL|nr:dienelactone hydrolase family protein [Stackebrandtia nassauensis]ADD41279.1 dienelactone hydrolase [Stackebrandtia nassauensis DSM 44728]
MTGPTEAVATVGERVNVGTSGMGAYVARPDRPGTYPGVLIGFEIFGVTPYIRRMADRVASLGYLAIAPDFHHRDAPGVELTADAEGRSRGLELTRRLTRASVAEDLDATREYLERRPEATGAEAMVGFSLGGHIGFVAAAHLKLKALAAFYPGWLTGGDIPLSTPEPTLELTDDISGRVLLVLGEGDHLIDAEQRDRIAARFAGTRHDLVVYPWAPHGFACDERESYDADYTRHAWSLVAKVLAEEL